MLGGDQNLYVALSPHLLLHVDTSKKCTDDGKVEAIPVSSEVQEVFRMRTIGNTFREIISSNKGLLEQWRQTAEFQRRHDIMVDKNQYNRMIASNAQGELWKINALGCGHRHDQGSDVDCE